MNNVNTREMEKFVAAIQADPAQAMKSKHATGSWQFEEGRPQFTAAIAYANGEIVLNAELPPFAGGWGASPDPVQYCLFGMAACFAATFAATAASERVPLSRLEVTAANWMDLRKQMGIGDENIISRVKFTVAAEGAPRDTMERLVRLAMERCPGVECVTQQIPLEVELSE
ncbi:MAG: OsmC family protein [Caldilineaceae bacterium]|nr:OsmC family protein [Caldilineaceae bacterium]